MRKTSFYLLSCVWSTHYQQTTGFHYFEHIEPGRICPCWSCCYSSFFLWVGSLVHSVHYYIRKSKSNQIWSRDQMNWRFWFVPAFWGHMSWLFGPLALSFHFCKPYNVWLDDRSFYSESSVQERWFCTCWSNHGLSRFPSWELLFPRSLDLRWALGGVQVCICCSVHDSNPHSSLE